MGKIKLWESKCENGDTRCSLQLETYLATGAVDKSPIIKIVHTYLLKLKNEFKAMAKAIVPCKKRYFQFSGLLIWEHDKIC